MRTGQLDYTELDELADLSRQREDMIAALDAADTAFAVFNLCGECPQTRAAVKVAWAKVSAAYSAATGRKNWFAELNPDIGPAVRLLDAAPAIREALRGLIDMATDGRSHGPEIDTAVSILRRIEGGAE